MRIRWTHLSLIVYSIVMTSILGCSERHAGGSSAETGNPELAGLLLLPNGKPAIAARIQCLPPDYNPLHDTLQTQWQTTSDSLGAFQLDSLKEGNCNLEAFHDTSKTRLWIGNIDVQVKSPIQLRASLAPTGALRIGSPTFVDGDSGWVVIPGTSIARAVVISFQSVFIDSLPVAIFDSIYFTTKNGTSSSLLANPVQVIANQTQSITAAPISFEKELDLNPYLEQAQLNDTLLGFPVAWVLDSNAIDFNLVHPDSGTLRISRSGEALGYRISLWDKESKRAILWVRVDTLLPLKYIQTLTLTYLEKDTSSIAWLTPPFSAADSVTAVWHMEDSSDAILDDGPYSLDGIRGGTKNEPGAIGEGNWFNGKSNYITIPGSESGPLNFPYDANATFSVWVRLDNPNTSRFVFGKGSSQYYLKYQYPRGWLFENNDEEAIPTYYWYEAPFDTIADVGKWFHLAVVLQKSSSTMLYVNGAFSDSVSAFHPRSDSLRFTGSTFEIGRRILPDFSTGQHFWGVIDELQIWHVAQSAAWIRMLYESQRPSEE